MCCTCCCPDYCNCNTSCCFGFAIPLRIGTVLAALWVQFNGLTFPLMSRLFWPQSHIMVPSCLLFAFVFTLGIILIVNMRLKSKIIFRTVIYGVFASYVAGSLMIITGLNMDQDGSESTLVESFQKNFNIRIPKGSAFQMLQSIQIVYYAYLFFSYVYCGVVFQLYERKYVKDVRKSRSNVFDRKTVVRSVDRTCEKASMLRKSTDGMNDSKEPREKKSVRIVLPEP